MINVSTIKPLDADLIVARARRTGAVVTAENHTVLGGLGGAVAEVLGDACPVPLRRVGIRDEFGTSGPLEELFPHYGLTAEAVCAAAGRPPGERRISPRRVGARRCGVLQTLARRPEDGAD